VGGLIVEEEKVRKQGSFQCLDHLSNRKEIFVGSIVIDAELGREDHGSIPHNCDRKRTGTT
jgi:hypothetical protein